MPRVTPAPAGSDRRGDKAERSCYLLLSCDAPRHTDARLEAAGRRGRKTLYVVFEMVY